MTWWPFLDGNRAALDLLQSSTRFFFLTCESLFCDSSFHGVAWLFQERFSRMFQAMRFVCLAQWAGTARAIVLGVSNYGPDGRLEGENENRRESSGVLSTRLRKQNSTSSSNINPDKNCSSFSSCSDDKRNPKDSTGANSGTRSEERARLEALEPFQQWQDISEAPCRIDLNAQAKATRDRVEGWTVVRANCRKGTTIRVARAKKCWFSSHINQ